MQTETPKDHPIQLISLYSDLAKRVLGSNFNFEFSKYVYVPQEI